MRRAWLVAALAAACSQPEKVEEELVLPRYPRGQALIEFFVAAASEFRFFVDAESLSVGRDDVVRYTLVARSPAGVENVSYEGLRCASGEARIYALGREGRWHLAQGGWKPIQPRWQQVLYREYFCPQKEPIASAREGIDALRSGGHSITRSLTEDVPRGGAR